MTRSTDDDETFRKHSGWLIPLGVFVVTFALSAMFLLLYLAPSAPSLFEEQITPTSRGDIIALKVHGHAFYIPANYLEYASARQGGSKREIALFALLPGMTGWSNWSAATFAGNSPDSPVIFMTIRDEKLNLTEAERLKRVYLGYVTDPKGKPGPYGLTQYRFKPGSGYKDDDLYVGDLAGTPIVLLCERPAAQVPSLNCRRDMLIAPGVSLSYRFKRTHLAQWRRIGEGVDRLVASFEKRPAKK